MAGIDFGIDLGTTNSSIVCCRSGALRIFQSIELMNVTPSVVYVGKSGRKLVGKKAYDAWPGDPQNVQAEFKRWMGFSDTLEFPAAGLTQAPLLQEPIAAAIAYGASAEGKSQRWLVFDLGGGTLDIAVVSTRNGRLAVLEHQGNNRLGGKDLDRVIAETLLWAPLSKMFRLPDRQEQPGNYD